MNILITLAFLPFLFSFKFNPMSQSLEVSKDKKSSQFIVENDTNESMAIELTVKERKMDEKGVETLPSTTDVSIFPPQIIIPSKEKRTIRVLWNGPDRVESEKSYRVIAEQLPLNVGKNKKGTGIQMLMKYMAAFYVSSEDAESKIQVSLNSITEGMIKFTVENTGTKHQIIYRPKLMFKKGPQKWTLKESDLGGFAGENILSRSKREFSIKSAEKIPTDAEVSLKIEE